MDKKLTGRVVSYMVNNPYIDVSIMASDLQLKYPRDYGRRRKNAFRKLVNTVYDIQKQKANMKKRCAEMQLDHDRQIKIQKENSFKVIENDSGQEFVNYSDTNLMNASLSMMYNGFPSENNTPIKLEVNPTPYSYEITYGKENESNNNQPTQKTVINNSTIDKSTDIHITTANSEITPPEDVAKKLDLKKKFRRRSSRPNRNNKVDNTDSIVDEIDNLRKRKFKFEESKVNFKNIGGNDKTLSEVCKLLIHVKHPEVYKTLGVSPPHGMLLHGPPGCGKSLLANAIAGEMSLPMLKLAGPEIVSGISGESEQKLRDVFETASENAPCIIFIDEIDAIAPKRENASKEQERRIVAQLLSCMDDLSDGGEQVLIIGATNRPDSLDPGLRRAGRFDREISMGIPSEKARKDILEVLCKDLKLQNGFNFSLIARLTPGYVGADLLSLCREAAASAVSRILTKEKVIPEVNCKNDDQNNDEDEKNKPELNVDKNKDEEVTDNSVKKINNTDKATELTLEEMLNWIKNPNSLSEEDLNDLSITMQDFETAMKVVQPSAKREGFATVPDVTWDDIGALKKVREELSMAILAPVRNPDVFKALGLEKPSGVLLAGPPGCGKTMLAKAIANESGINFISVKGPELLNMYVGESERAVRQCFQRAQNSSPCVIFFDELDSLCPRRSGMDTGSSARVVNQMLTEMDGLQCRKQVFVMGATNRPDIIDPAILRPGRLDKILHVDLPDESDRYEILEAITKFGTRPRLSSELSLEKVAKDERCKRFTGADLSALVREASVNALKNYISQEHVLKGKTADVFVTWENFDNAFEKVKPSVSAKDQLSYNSLK